MKATVNDLAFAGAVGVDYNQNPLKSVTIEDFRISRFGQIKIEISGEKKIGDVLTELSNRMKKQIIHAVNSKIKESLLEFINSEAILKLLETTRENAMN